MLSTIRNLYRRARYGKPVIVVSGLPRSGTSMAMKMLDAAGLEMVVDGIREADVDNPKGYYELERIKDLANESDKSYLRDARGKVVKVISFLLKELPDDNNYKVIFMRRHIDEVLASQTKMLKHREEADESKDEQMRELFKADLWRANYLIKNSAHFEAIHIVYSEVLTDPLIAAKQICNFLNLSVEPTQLAGVVDNSLYRNRAEK